MSNLVSVAWPLLPALFLALGGCAGLPSSPPATPEKPASTSAPVVLPFRETETPPKALDADLVYNYLAGEIGAYRGGSKAAYAHLIQAARAARDPMAAAEAARMAIRLDEQEKAAAATDLWVRYAPNSLPARQLATILALRGGEIETAIRQADATVRISQAIGKDGFLQLATMLAGEKAHGKLQLMEALVARNPDDPRAHYALALVASQSQQFDRAGQALRQAIRLDPAWDRPRLLQARILILQGQREAAQALLQQAIHDHPSSRLLQALGRMQMEAKAYAAATESFRQAARLDPGNPEILATLGVLGIQTRDWALAKEAWKTLASGNDSARQQEAWYFLGQLEELQERPEQAVKYYKRVESGRFLQDARLRQAILAGRAGKLAEAASLFREVRLMAPERTAETFITEAQLYKELGHPERALETYNQAIAANPGNADLLYARGLLHADRNEVEAAERDFRAVLELAPDDADALNALGYTLADQTDRLQEALAYISRAYQQDPDNAAILDSMGWVLYRMGRLEEALAFLEQAASKLEDGEISAHLGEVLWKLGREEQARKVWQEALKHSPDNRYLQQTIKRFLQ